MSVRFTLDGAAVEARAALDDTRGERWQALASGGGTRRAPGPFRCIPVQDRSAVAGVRGREGVTSQERAKFLSSFAPEATRGVHAGDS